VPAVTEKLVPRALFLLSDNGIILQSYRDNPKINAIVLVKGKLDDWPKLPPIPIEPEEDELTEEHKVLKDELSELKVKMSLQKSIRYGKMSLQRSIRY
jgi:hypothetical protein